MKKLLVCVAAVVMAMGCSNESPEQVDSGEGFVLLKLDATTLEATYRSGGESVRALVCVVAPDIVEVTYDFGNPVIGFRIDYDQGVGQFMPSGTALDAAQARLIESLLSESSQAVPQESSQRTRVEDVALRQTSF